VRRIGGLALLGLAAAGCKDSGLPGRNTPVAEAERTAASYIVYENAAAPAVTLGDQRWMAAGPPIRIPARMLVPVGRDAARDVYALASDPEPYTRLYVKSAGGLTPLARVPNPAH
jgi:hypothetical protein